MDYKQKVDYLYGYRNAIAKIEGNLDEYERWMTIGAKCTQTIRQDTGGNSGEKRIEKAAIMMADIARQIDADTHDAVVKRDDILKTIRTKSRRKRYELFLEMRFVKGLSTYKIAAIIDKDVRTVQRVMRKAIDSLDI